jgi:cytochrome P450
VLTHVTVGMRFAKLEMSVITAVFFAMFDYELVDPRGNPMVADQPDRNMHSAHKPSQPMRLKYTVRPNAF